MAKEIVDDTTQNEQEVDSTETETTETEVTEEDTDSKTDNPDYSDLDKQDLIKLATSLQQDKDNYHKGMTKAQSKLKEIDDANNEKLEKNLKKNKKFEELAEKLTGEKSILTDRITELESAIE